MWATHSRRDFSLSHFLIFSDRLSVYFCFYFVFSFYLWFISTLWIGELACENCSKIFKVIRRYRVVWIYYNILNILCLMDIDRTLNRVTLCKLVFCFGFGVGFCITCTSIVRHINMSLCKQFNRINRFISSIPFSSKKKKKK